MRIAMIGAGRVGLVSAACLSELGMQVTCVDRSPCRIAALNRGEMPIHEPGLADLVARNVAAGRLGFMAGPAAALRADVVFIAVGTPGQGCEGRADVSEVIEAATDIARALESHAVVAIKSTVPVGTGRAVAGILEGHRGPAGFDLASNPEFLREGSAVGDFMRPCRIVLGVESDRAAAAMERLYRPLAHEPGVVVRTTIETAELIKYAVNGFLATRIAFINQIADLCETAGADVADVAHAMGLDAEIGARSLSPGPGYGGSCLPKDARALARTARDHGVPATVIEAVVAANEARKGDMARRIADRAGGVEGRTVAVLGLTYKAGTCGMSESPSLAIVPELMRLGARIRAFDPAGMADAAELMPGIVACGDVYEALEGADALVIATEWAAFRALELDRARAVMRRPLAIDLRNLFSAAEMTAAGFDYHGIGRGASRPLARQST